MAIVKKGTWINADGLPVDFGLDEAKLAAVAEYRENGPARLIEVTIYDASAFNATDDYVLDSKISIPEGAIVTKVEVGPNVVAFASSGAGVISVGTIDKDQASNSDIDSLLASATVAEMNAGGTAAGDGVLVQGAALTSAKFLTLSVDTAVFQAGSGTVRIWYEIPKPEADGLVWNKSA